MKKFDELYSRIIAEMTELTKEEDVTSTEEVSNGPENEAQIDEDVYGNDEWTWTFRAVDAATGEQIGEVMDDDKKLIESLEDGPDKVYIYEMATDANGKQVRNRKNNILVADGKGGWKSIWSRLQQDLARERAADERRDNLRPLYKKFIPMAGKGWDYTVPEQADEDLADDGDDISIRKAIDMFVKSITAEHVKEAYQYIMDKHEEFPEETVVEAANRLEEPDNVSDTTDFMMYVDEYLWNHYKKEEREIRDIIGEVQAQMARNDDQTDDINISGYIWLLAEAFDEYKDMSRQTYEPDEQNL